MTNPQITVGLDGLDHVRRREPSRRDSKEGETLSLV